MEIELPQSGGCQCGNVRYQVTGQPLMLYACHCTECQRQSGSAFGLSLRLRPDDLQHDPARLKHFMREADSKREMACYFCPDCGVRIYHARPSRPGSLTLKPGTLDDTGWLRPTAAIWLRSAQGWVPLPDGFARFDTQPEKFSVLALAAS